MHEVEAQAAVDGIKKHGRDAHLIPVSNGDDWDSDVSEGSPISVKVLQTKLQFSEIDEKNVRVTDLKFLLDGTVRADKTMKLRDSGTGQSIDYEIGYVEYIQPGTRLVLQKVFARV